MKLNRIILPAMTLALAFALAGCEDNKMEWGTPEGHGQANLSDIPLGLAEKIANYKTIKEYVTEYAPQLTIGLGIGADYYMNNETVKQLADENFQMFTTGNAMKHSSVVKNNGDLDFTTIDAFLNAIPQDMKMYGHNLIWHTQQKQAYLKSLIAPEVVTQPDENDVCENVISNYGFEENLDGWSSWNHHTKEIVSPGYESNGALKLTVNGTSTNFYDDQLFWVCDNVLEVGTTYAFQFWAKTATPGAKVQFVLQATSGNPQDWGATFDLTGSWVKYTGEYTIPADKEGLQRIGIQFGGMEAEIYIDDFKFGKKIDDPDSGRTNLLTNGSFTDNIDTWAKYNGPDGCNTWNGTEGNKAKGCLQVVNSMTEPSNQWKLQIHSDITGISEDIPLYISYYVKTTSGAGSVRCSTTGSAKYQGDQTIADAWQRIEWKIDNANGVTGLNFDLAAVPNTYLIDDVVISTEPFTTSDANAQTKAISRAGGITYKPKSAEEKRTILLNAMGTWIKGILTHTGMDRVKEWDVINEPIADGNNGWRGINNVFGVTDSEGVADTAPTETEESGLKLNWASDHFYWGYYLGMEYATKAFEYSRQYAPAGTKLYVNEYNLETSPGKLAALIDFVKYIDEHNETGFPIVDGIGTQMHVVSNIKKEEVDAMFKTLAATGKTIRVTELDVRIGYEATANPTVEQQQTQADVYRMIIESYKANVPEAQQSGITIWGLSDHADEHVYWYTGDTPNIFDANYARKIAYKGVCDGIAGRDISEDFTGDNWKNAYPAEKEEE